MDLNIENLSLTIENAAGHEHRVGHIAELAAEILARHAAAGLPERGASIESAAAPAVALDLARATDAEAAARIAEAALDALRFQLRT